jgi:hypothetical protein
MTRGWETNGTGAGRRRTRIRPLRRGSDPGSRIRGILEGNEAALAEAIVGVVVAGGGLLVSSTRDGGAVGIHLYAGDARASDFSASAEDLGALLETLEDVMKELGLVESKGQARGPETGA